MLFSMVAWVLRFGLLAYGTRGAGIWMIILSCIVYGMAFDFFNISGSLFVETQTRSVHPGQCPGPVHDDDQRLRRRAGQLRERPRH